MSELSESEAAAFAIRAHGGQRYGDRPYAHHLIAVAENLRRFGVATPELVCAAWLHDTVEDTEVSLETVRAEFGDRVAELVSAVTTSDGPNRKERNALTYPRIAATPGAVLVKLADRIANVESSWDTRDSRLFMYRKEYPGFREALRGDDPKLGAAMWDHLDTLLGWWRD